MVLIDGCVTNVGGTYTEEDCMKYKVLTVKDLREDSINVWK